MKMLFIALAALAAVPTVLTAQERLNSTDPQPTCHMCPGGYIPVSEI